MIPLLIRRHTDDIGIDGDTGIDDANHAVDVHLAGLQDRDLRNLRHEATERIVHAHASAAPVGERLAPTCNFGRAVEDMQGAGIAAEHRAAIIYRVLFCNRRQFVDETLNHIDVMRRSNASPKRRRNAGRLLAHVLDALIRNGIGHVNRTIDRIGIDAVLERGRKNRAMIDEPTMR